MVRRRQICGLFLDQPKWAAKGRRGSFDHFGPAFDEAFLAGHRPQVRQRRVGGRLIARGNRFCELSGCGKGGLGEMTIDHFPVASSAPSGTSSMEAPNLVATMAISKRSNP